MQTPSQLTPSASNDASAAAAAAVAADAARGAAAAAAPAAAAHTCGRPPVSPFAQQADEAPPFAQQADEAPPGAGGAGPGDEASAAARARAHRLAHVPDLSQARRPRVRGCGAPRAPPSRRSRALTRAGCAACLLRAACRASPLTPNQGLVGKHALPENPVSILPKTPYSRTARPTCSDNTSDALAGRARAGAVAERARAAAVPRDHGGAQLGGRAQHAAVRPVRADGVVWRPVCPTPALRTISTASGACAVHHPARGITL